MIRRTCLQCKKDFNFRAFPSDVNSGRGKYCSRKCNVDRQRTLPRAFECQYCHSEFPNKYGKFKKFCSKRCYDKSLVGKTPWNKGIPTPPAVIAKLSAARKGKPAWSKGKENPKVRGERNGFWKGGVSFHKIAYRKKRRMYELAADGFHTLADWQELKLRFDNRCLACNRREPEVKLTKDHIIPITKGGSDYITNLQPLCLPCNSRKKDKIINYAVQ